MSIILDALKKVETDRTKKTENPSSSPSPFSLASQPAPSRNFLSPQFLVLLGILLAGSLGIWGYRTIAKRRAHLPSPAVAQTVNTPVAAQNSEALKKDGLALYTSGDLEKSQAKFEEALKSNKQDPEIYNNLGLIYKKLGKLNEAQKSYEQALSLKENYPEALNNLGVVWITKGDLLQARSSFEKASSLKSDYAEPRFHLALLDEKEGKNSDALKHYDEGLKASPNLDPKIRGQINMRILLLKGE
jgi:tetratricopeptide (TPR) repeat protein